MNRGTSLQEPFRTIVALLEEMDEAPEGLELYDWALLSDTERIAEFVEDADGDPIPIFATTSPFNLLAFSVGGTYNGFDFRAGWNEFDRIAALVYSPARVP